MALRRRFRIPAPAPRVTPTGAGHTTDGSDPRLGHGVDETPQPAQHDVYLVLSAEERAQGFVRPVRTSYIHLTCGAVTRMSLPLAETYARDPRFYGATWCCRCSMHRPVGEDGEFVWDIPAPPFGSMAAEKEWLNTVPPKVGT